MYLLVPLQTYQKRESLGSRSIKRTIFVLWLSLVYFHVSRTRNKSHAFKITNFLQRLLNVLHLIDRTETNHGFFFCPDKGEAVLQPTRGHAPKSNDSKKPVSSEKGRSDNFQYNFLQRLRYHRFDGIFVWKRGCLGNTSFQKLPPSCLFTSELPKIASRNILSLTSK